MNISFNKADLISYLESQHVQSNEIKDVSSIFDECDALDNEDKITDGKISSDSAWGEFCKRGTAKLAHLQDVIISFRSSKCPQMTEEEIEADRAVLAEKIKKTFEGARDKLVKQLENSSMTYPDPVTGKECFVQNLIKYLNNLDFKSSPYGSAQALKGQGRIEVNTTPSDGKNPPPLSSQWNFSEAETMKILLHEALHNAYYEQKADPGFDTQAEELYCERNAITLISQLIQDNGDNNYGISYNELASDPQLMDDTLRDRFINSGYQNRPKDASGSVNIEGHEIPGGSVVYVGGEKVGVIGPSEKDCLILDELNSNTIVANGRAFGDYNKVVMNEVHGAKTLEIKDDKDNIIFSAFLIPDSARVQKPQMGY